MKEKKRHSVSNGLYLGDELLGFVFHYCPRSVNDVVLLPARGCEYWMRGSLKHTVDFYCITLMF